MFAATDPWGLNFWGIAVFSFDNKGAVFVDFGRESNYFGGDAKEA